MTLAPLDGRVLQLFDSGGAVALVVAVAAGAGALHALAPGHGKTLTAAYLVGERGRSRDALLLGVSVAVMHTLSVALLALGWYGLLEAVPADLGKVTALLQLVAASFAIAVGLGLLERQRRRRRGASGHDHHHVPGELARPFSRRGLAVLAVSGGLVPSPSAFLVLVSGLVAGRLGLAIGLVAAFGVGMATTLAVVGLLALRGHALLTGAGDGRPRLQRLVRMVPPAAALLVTAGGLVLGVSAVAALVRA